MSDGLNEIYKIVCRVLEPKEYGTWLNTAIPALDYRTPYNMMTDGEDKELLEYVQTYLDQSFS